MKKLLLIAAIGMISLAAVPAKAQVSLSVNIGLQPQWGPRGYNHVDYYYLPDVDCYYDVPSRNYIYFEGNSWVHRAYLPVRYRNYDLYGGRKVVINSPNPWLRHDAYRSRYVTNYRGGYNRGPRAYARPDFHRGGYYGGGRDFDRFRRGGNRFEGRRGNEFQGRGNEFQGRGNDRGNFNRGGNDHGNFHGDNRGNGNRGGDNRGGDNRGNGGPRRG